MVFYHTPNTVANQNTESVFVQYVQQTGLCFMYCSDCFDLRCRRVRRHKTQAETESIKNTNIFDKHIEKNTKKWYLIIT